MNNLLKWLLTTAQRTPSPPSSKFQISSRVERWTKYGPIKFFLSLFRSNRTSKQDRHLENKAEGGEIRHSSMEGGGGGKIIGQSALLKDGKKGRSRRQRLLSFSAPKKGQGMKLFKILEHPRGYWAVISNGWKRPFLPLNVQENTKKGENFAICTVC